MPRFPHSSRGNRRNTITNQGNGGTRPISLCDELQNWMIAHQNATRLRNFRQLSSRIMIKNRLNLESHSQPLEIQVSGERTKTGFNKARKSCPATPDKRMIGQKSALAGLLSLNKIDSSFLNFNSSTNFKPSFTTFSSCHLNYMELSLSDSRGRDNWSTLKGLKKLYLTSSIGTLSEALTRASSLGQNLESLRIDGVHLSLEVIEISTTISSDSSTALNLDQLLRQELIHHSSYQESSLSFPLLKELIILHPCQDFLAGFDLISAPVLSTIILILTMSSPLNEDELIIWLDEVKVQSILIVLPLPVVGGAEEEEMDFDIEVLKLACHRRSLSLTILKAAEWSERESQTKQL